jgi:hypothetical protein
MEVYYMTKDRELYDVTLSFQFDSPDFQRTTVVKIPTFWEKVKQFFS